MKPQVHITGFFSPALNLLIRREPGGNMAVIDYRTGAARIVGSEEANAIALAVLDGSGVPEFSRSGAGA